jgi:hypothetical protein
MPGGRPGLGTRTSFHWHAGKEMSCCLFNENSMNLNSATLGIRSLVVNVCRIKSVILPSDFMR